ncbi:signal recognition particle-docking protein FtsY [Burkholderia sp. Ch1-1]|nr:signal recognition particle-docking protein FtsY [Burkholderia sp. Ch1-1]
MFSFFKRFKGSKESDNAPEESQTAPEGSTPGAAVQAPTPVAPATPRPAAAPARVETPAPSAIEPEPEESAPETVEIVPPPRPDVGAKRSWLTRLKTGLSKTSSSLTGIFVGAKIDEDLYEELETALLMSDAGVDATEYLLEALREKVRAERLTDPQQVKAALRTLLVDLLRPLEKSLMLGRAQPLVMMIAGVNGAGKTTSIGKLAKHLQSFDQSVLLAAGDTFRAAAREQLAIWGQRNNVTVVSQESGDPAAVIFDAVGAARARKIDVMMADTAGRLPTQLHLMEELRKVKRVIGKAQEGAPHEVLLVIDANTGQNALAQVKAFDDALGLTGLIVTKLDGTAKGGILAAIARQRPIPVYFIGVGEKVEDLQPFSAEEFSDALLGG